MNKDRLDNGNYVETCANHFVLLVKDNVGGTGSNYDESYTA